MIGAIIIVLVIVVIIPVGLMMFGGVMSGIFGWTLKDHAAQEHSDSPYLDLNQ